MNLSKIGKLLRKFWYFANAKSALHYCFAISASAEYIFTISSSVEYVFG